MSILKDPMHPGEVLKELYLDGIDCDRWNRLHPDTEPRDPWVRSSLADTDGVYVIAYDYVKALPQSIGRWFPSPPAALGTDGFGRSESRAALRRFFEVDAASIVVATLDALSREGKVDREVVQDGNLIITIGLTP